MKKMLYFKVFLLLLIGITISAGCKKDSIKSGTIKYGTFFGMCGGVCNSEVEINAVTSTYKGGPHSNPTAISCNADTDPAVFKAITNSINNGLVMALPDVIGCPDCADGGGEWVEITVNGKKKKVTFEYGNAPDGLKKAVEKLRTLKASFKCQ